MVIRNCLQLLLELSRLEEKIAQVQSDRPKDENKDKEIIERHLRKIQRFM